MTISKGLHPTDNSAIEPNSFRLDVSIESASGKERDISNLVQTFTVYESIFQQPLIAELDIADGLSLFEDLNISGNEKISTVVRKQNTKDEPVKDIQNDWYVLDIPLYGKPKPDLATYKIRCISPLGLVAKFRKISTTLSGSSAEILQELYRQVGAELEMLDEQTLGTMKYVCPKLTYADAIAFILRKSMAGNGAPMFTYQRFDDSKYVLNSYNNMITSDVLDTYWQGSFYTHEDQTDESFEEKRLRILEASSNLGFSPFKSMKDGSYVTRTHRLDISNKVYEVIDYNAFEDEPILIDGSESDLVWNREFTVSGVSPLDLKESYNIFINQNNLAMVEHDHVNVHGFGSYKMAYKHSVYSNLEQIEHTLKLNGDTRLMPGTVIEVLFPKTGQVDSAGRESDEMLSGRYLIVSSTHQFDQTGYYTRLKVRRDSVHKR